MFGLGAAQGTQHQPPPDELAKSPPNISGPEKPGEEKPGGKQPAGGSPKPGTGETPKPTPKPKPPVVEPIIGIPGVNEPEPEEENTESPPSKSSVTLPPWVYLIH
jgi:hypothetical protein